MERYVPLKAVNWLGDGPLAAAEGLALHVRTRSTRSPVAARLMVSSGETAVILDEPETGVSPGQACVFYERSGSGARILGGGIIATAWAPGEKGASPGAAIRLENRTSVAI
jgi:tRNA-specific 2-thiouridylase